MIAYTAEYAGGDMRPCDAEIADAQWFSIDALPQLPSPISVSRKLIDVTIERRCGMARDQEALSAAEASGALRRIARSIRSQAVLIYVRTPRRLAIAGVVVCSAAPRPAAPPPLPSSSITQPALPPGLSVELRRPPRSWSAKANTMRHAARSMPSLASDAKNPQARFIRGVIRNRRGDGDEAIATFRGLTEDYPELPEPHNNLAVIWAKRGSIRQGATLNSEPRL